MRRTVLVIGKTLGRYRILEKLGSGGMGEVYRAHDEQLDRDVAIKVLSSTGCFDPAARSRLLREARSAAALNHPHICTVYEVGEAEGQAYLAMELVEGHPLSARLLEGPLRIEQVLRYGLQLAEALAHAHERGVVHRDLKSANVIITPEGRAKVLDFGLAKRATGVQSDEATRSQSMLTLTGTITGTLAYMAPEQLLGQAADARSDIWALGVVLFEMVAGVRPFQGQTSFELSSAILNRTPPQPSSAPVELQTVIARCLAKEPGQRYQRAGEICAVLEMIGSGQVHTPVEAVPTAAWGPVPPGDKAVPPLEGSTAPAAVGRFMARRRILLLATLALVVLCGATAVFDLGGLRTRLLERGRKINSLVVLPLTNNSGDPKQEYIADGTTEALIAELSQVAGLKVTSRTSAMQYKGTKKRLREITSELGVDAALEGGVLKEGDQVRVTVQLIDGRTDQSLWAKNFDREISGILSLQGDVVRAIAGELQVKLSAQEEALLSRSRPVNPEAYEAYLKGRMYWYKQSPQDVDRALQYFQFAVEKDPSFSLAYIGMGYVWTYYASTGMLPPGEARKRLAESVSKAISIDPNLAEAHEGRGDFHYYYEWDWAKAEEEYKRAIELKPNSADMRVFYSEFLGAMKRLPEAEVQVKKCMELDPFNSYVQMIYGMYLLSAHRFDKAVDQFQKVLKADQDFGPANLGLWAAYHHKGMLKEALAAAKVSFAKWGDEEMPKVFDLGYAKGGYREAMRQGAQKLEARFKEMYVLPTQIAQVYAYAGEKDKSLDWLEKAFEERDTGIVKIQIDPDWDTLRDEPRFQEILRKMKFPPS